VSPAGARFCPACGVPAPAETGAREERKVVTVLFADLVGFTSRAEALDPEDVRALIRPFHDLLRREIEAYGGTLARVVGDAGMAVFGYPSAHEDDPERAVRAALAIQEALRGLDADPVAAGLHARIGINTTEAVVTYGSVLEDADDLMGDGVNAAARIQAVAPPDGVVVGETTRAATSRTIAYAELPPAGLRGRSAPMRLFRVVGPIARVPGDRPDATPFVGRDAELGLIVNAFERARAARTVQTVTIVADPGLGKSRLVRELGRHLDGLPDLVTWRSGRCLPYGEGIGFWAIGEIVRGHAGILDTDSREVREAKLQAVVAEPDGQVRQWMLDRLAPLAGGASRSEPPTRDEAFAAWRRFLASIAAVGPAVFVIEDLHWADDALVDLLETLADDTVGLPLLLVVTARPEIGGRHPGWLARTRGATVLPLAGLPDAEMRVLIAAVLGAAPAGSGAAPPLGEAVLERAEGSPLYAEQLAAMLRDRTAAAGAPDAPATDSTGGGAVPGASDRSPADVIPPSIHALLASRIDALPAVARAALLDASVVGKRFWPGAVAAVGGRAPEAVRAALHELARRELVRPVTPSSMDGEDEYAFWHALVRDVAYGALTRPDRLARHRRVAEWITALRGPAEGATAEIVAAHLERALDLAGALGGTGMAPEAAPPGDADAHAGPHLAGATATSLLQDLIAAHLASADHAMRTEVPRAVAHLRRALELLEPGGPGRPAILEQLGRALNSTGDVRAAVAALEEAAGAYRAVGDAAGAAGIAPVLAVALAFTGEGERAHAVLADARDELADRPGLSLVAVIAEQAMSAMVANRLESAAALADEAISLGAALGLRPPHRALHARGWVRYPADPDAGEADFRASIDVAVDVGAIQSAGGAMQNLAIARGNVLGPVAALAALDEARAFRAVHGLPEMPVRLSRLDELEVAGDWDAVVAEAEPVRAWAEARGDAWAAWSVDFVMASVRLARGERVGSQEDLVARGRDVGMPGYAAPVAALAAIAEGDPSAARAILAAALDGLSPGEIDRPAFFVRACVRCGAVDLARRVLELGTTPAPLEAAGLLAAEAMLAEAEGDPTHGREGYVRAAEALGRLGMRPEEAHALEGLGRCLLALGEAEAGAARLRAARHLWERIGAPPRIAAIDALLGSG
jgi:class 3 adenylate cyclase/tetratricopeptide (TPR) repeat protein